MQLTIEQVREMAPDEKSVAAGKKLAAPRSWDQLGQNEHAVWGLCRGSATYQVKVDLSNLGYHCTCPSRKFPCKHVLALLMMWAQSPELLASGESPQWIADWLQRRRQRAEKTAQKKDTGAKKPVDRKAQQRRAAQRRARVADGVERFDLWLKDLVRNGLGSVESKPASFWQQQAKRLVDAQAPGLAGRVARLAEIPRSSPDWPARLLAELGRLKLLVLAWQRIEQLDADLQHDVRQLLGWTVSQEELAAAGRPVEDTWVFVGQWTDDDGRLRIQRTWAVGRNTGKTALILQFAAGSRPFAESIVAGIQCEGTMTFYPGAVEQRARMTQRRSEPKRIEAAPPGHPTVEKFLESVAESLGRQPWLDSFAGVLQQVTVVRHCDVWYVRDRHSCGIPLLGSDHWKLLALSGGRPFELAGEWNGHCLRPLGLFAEGTYRVL